MSTRSTDPGVYTEQEPYYDPALDVGQFTESVRSLKMGFHVRKSRKKSKAKKSGKRKQRRKSAAGR